MNISASDLRKFFPRGQKDWIDALVRLAPQLLEAGEITTCGRWCHLMAQIAAETDGLALPRMRENMHYRPARILEVFDYRVRLAQKSNKQFKGKSLAEIAAMLAASPDLLAETVYGGRKELGNVHPGDGAKFIGRGPLQTTGREWYAKLGTAIGIDLVAEPHRLEEPDIGWLATFHEWRILGANVLADKDNVEMVSRRVNGGTNGMARRKREYVRAAAIWPDDDAPIGAPITPRHADEPPATITAKTLADDGSRSMSWLQSLRIWLTTSGAGITGWLGLETFTSTRGTLHELKTLVSDHALVILLANIGIVLLGVLLVQHFYVRAAREGRYSPREG